MALPLLVALPAPPQTPAGLRAVEERDLRSETEATIFFVSRVGERVRIETKGQHRAREDREAGARPVVAPKLTIPLTDEEAMAFLDWRPGDGLRAGTGGSSRSMGASSGAGFYG